jgi:hypothetical protein
LEVGDGDISHSPVNVVANLPDATSAHDVVVVWLSVVLGAKCGDMPEIGVPFHHIHNMSRVDYYE